MSLIEELIPRAGRPKLELKPFELFTLSSPFELERRALVGGRWHTTPYLLGEGPPSTAVHLKAAHVAVV